MPARDYSRYEMSRREKAVYSVVPLAIIFFVSFLCYDNFFFSVILLPYIPIYISAKRKKLIAERRWKLNIQFGDSIACMSAALEAGYSVENAVREAYTDMKMSYSEEDMIMEEYRFIMSSIMNSRTIEEAFGELAERSGLEDIKSFADIFATAKRTGGNVIHIIRETSKVIRTRVELKRELKTIISAKKYESDIMKFVPVFLILYLRVCSPDMIASLYGNIKGILFMTAVLVIYLVLCRISDRLVDMTL